MITLRELVAQWPNRTHLVIPNLSFKPGDRVAVLGPNGAGKTTLLRSLAGLDAVLERSFFIEEKSLANLSNQLRAKAIAYIPAETHLSYPFLIRDIVCWGRFANHQGQPKTADWDRVTYWLSAFDLTHLASTPITAVSTGEKQRALMARLFVSEAKLKILDEPFARLDFGQVERIRNLWQLPELSQQVLIASHHDIFNLYNWATRILLLASGTIVECPKIGEAETIQAIIRSFQLANESR